MRPLKAVSLFSGLGLLDLGLEWAGIEAVAQVEINAFCHRILEKRFPNALKCHDIKNVKGEVIEHIKDRGPIDIVCGGPPCQPFSVAGKRRGKDDDRYLWPEMLRIVRELRPNVVIFENVPGIVGMALATVLSDLEAAGYEIPRVKEGEPAALVIPACAVGTPHQRYRVFVVAYARRLGATRTTRDAENDVRIMAHSPSEQNDIRE